MFVCVLIACSFVHIVKYKSERERERERERENVKIVLLSVTLFCSFLSKSCVNFSKFVHREIFERERERERERFFHCQMSNHINLYNFKRERERERDGET